ncbi:MAG TPA: hypothetical protein H9899_07230 [Candidatus Sphingomonas excrementigallinarum]|nr:hypothetical protein [Candidatus Sphingomonas excrementigallinarum]
MIRWQYQATGDETEVFDSADDNAIPLVLVPFLESETAETHQARVRMVVAAPQANDLLRQALDLLNDRPNFGLRRDASVTSYDLAGKIDTHFKEAANG